MLKRLLLFIFYLSLVFPGACSTDESSDDYSFENNGIMPDFAVANYPKVPVLDCDFDKLPVIDNGYYLNSTLSSTGITSVPGIKKSAVSFGYGGKISIKDKQCLNFGYGDFSFSLWIKTTNDDAVILNKRKNFSDQGYLLKLHNGALLLQVNDSSKGFYNYFNSTDSVNIADGNWHHLAGSVDRDSSSGIKIYVDGYLSFQGNALYRTADISNTSDLQIGGSEITLDELKLFNRVISQEEITNLKRDPNCIAKYTFEETLADISGNGHPLNVAEGSKYSPLWFRYVNEYGNVAGTFVSSYDKLSMPSSKKIMFNTSLAIAFSIWTKDSNCKVMYQNTGGLKIDLADGRPRVCIRYKDKDVYLTAKTRVDDGKWHHVVFSYYNAYDAYENGENNPEAYIVVDNHVDDTYSIDSRNSLYVGDDNISIGGFTGQIDNLSFYNKEIPVSEAIALYYSTQLPGKLVVNNGRLSVQSVKGEIPIQLKGMSTAPLHNSDNRTGAYTNYNSIKYMRDTWGANLIRATVQTEGSASGNGTVYDQGYCDNSTRPKLYAPVSLEKNQARIKGYLEDIIKSCIDLGVYVIIDWHITVQSDPNPQKNIKESLKFFKEMAYKYGDYPNILFEICNEPGSTNDDQSFWSNDIKPYANDLTKAIRRYSPGIILVGAPICTQNLAVAYADKLSDKNTMYSYHPYMNIHKHLLTRMIEYAKRGFPIFVTEYGITHYAGPLGMKANTERMFWVNNENIAGSTSSTIGTQESYYSTPQPEVYLHWADVMDYYGISSANWQLCYDQYYPQNFDALLPSALNRKTNWTDEDLSPSGKAARDIIMRASTKGVYSRRTEPCLSILYTDSPEAYDMNIQLSYFINNNHFKATYRGPLNSITELELNSKNAKFNFNTSTMEVSLTKLNRTEGSAPLINIWKTDDFEIKNLIVTVTYKKTAADSNFFTDNIGLPNFNGNLTLYTTSDGVAITKKIGSINYGEFISQYKD
ncbi:MAG TPA: cellulase family glycosylhydrolase [Spirochaetota bacterium]|nr:cellulase family glycosylhydrolase [Spirochaetota bacterium]HPY02337.1 cellulase family glycosylhydrolase [Spirochaetota bacterium]HQA51837.1 cellulase family glycosylhydrolase [Spirochaetota bacterium]